MTRLPHITVDPPGIKVLNLREAQNAIRRKYGPRYHIMDEALRDVAALWGIAPHDDCINDCGVFIPYELITCRTARASAEIRIAESPSGLFAMDISYSAPISGAGAAPSVWNRIAFLGRDDARMAGLHELIGISLARWQPKARKPPRPEKCLSCLKMQERRNWNSSDFQVVNSGIF